jgi:UDP-N-acetylglucosamine diphosphorylase / glucose-1-phosphate thymidylyltransferase / UDP-N-acetylgalactosamine diphosphorylase / glucosamine-1-phosphate N-acetyltransferase / galactosamine-1-phosphate N-acetyltransferase
MNTLEFNKLICYENLLHAALLPKDLISLISDYGKQWIIDLLKTHDAHHNPVVNSPLAKNVEIEGAVYIGKNVKIEPGVYIKGPAFISANSELRHTSYIREYSYIGEKCVVGHATEVKHSFFFDGAKASHFAYVGNSILGRNVNLGAGTRLANFKLNRGKVSFTHPFTKEKINSGTNKFGAILGDNSQTGCNCVLSPGTITLPNTLLLPCKHYRGTIYS